MLREVSGFVNDFLFFFCAFVSSESLNGLVCLHPARPSVRPSVSASVLR